MADKNPNIIIDIHGDTAEMGTDYNTSGTGLTGAHVQITKLAWGDSDTTERITANRPLPVQIQGGTGPLDVIITDAYGITYTRNKQNSSGAVEYFAVAGTTSGGVIGTKGSVWGQAGATAITVTGDVRLPANSVIRMVGVTTDLYLGPEFGGITFNAASGATYAQYHPIAITGGRSLNYQTDSVRIDNTTIGISGGRQLTASTDSIKVFGSDGGNFVRSTIHDNTGITAGFSGDYIKVWMGGADINATVNVSSTHGVTNATEPPLRVQGYPTGQSHNPVIVKGENGSNAAIEVQASSGLSTSISNKVTIDDSNLIQALESSNKPLNHNLSNIITNTNSITKISNDLMSGNIKASVTQSAPIRLYSGFVSIASMNTTPLGSSQTLSRGVNIKNSPLSLSSVAIGSSNLSGDQNSGFVLEPGESIYIDIDNVSKVFVRAIDQSRGNVQATVSYVAS